MLEFLVASNIAEGYGRGSRGEYRHFLGITRGSNYEVQTQIVIARELAFGEQRSLDKAELFSAEVGKMLVAIVKNWKVNKIRWRGIEERDRVAGAD